MKNFEKWKDYTQFEGIKGIQARIKSQITCKQMVMVEHFKTWKHQKIIRENQMSMKYGQKYEKFHNLLENCSKVRKTKAHWKL